MTRRFVHAFDAPGDTYRRPLVLSADRLETTLVTRLVCLDHLVREDELARLIREQAEEMAGKEPAP